MESTTLVHSTVPVERSHSQSATRPAIDALFQPLLLAAQNVEELQQLAIARPAGSRRPPRLSALLHLSSVYTGGPDAAGISGPADRQG